MLELLISLLVHVQISTVQMLEKNDYPTDTCTIEKSKKSKKGSIQRNGTLHQQKGKTYRDGVLSLPYIADEVT